MCYWDWMKGEKRDEKRGIKGKKRGVDRRHFLWAIRSKNQVREKGRIAKKKKYVSG